MITDPRIILMDEPTSGLDSFNAFSVLKILKRQTKSFGCSIVCTLHQPSSDLFKLFDRVICLSEGHTLYNGSVADIKPYFEAEFGL
jgi:ABC-type multidrug transport system ATPase subunit